MKSIYFFWLIVFVELKFIFFRRIINFFKNVSGERIWMELQKILIGRFASPIIVTMLNECKLQKILFLSEFGNLNEFRRVAKANLIAETGHLNLEPSTALATLFFSMEETDAFQKRVKFSNSELFLCQFIVSNRKKAMEEKDNLLYFKKLLLDQIFTSGCEFIFYFFCF